MKGIYCIAALALMVCAGPLWSQAEDRRPNIIFITVDTFRAERVSYDGYHRPTSPHLDSLAAEGVFFKQAFTSSGWTTPGLISLLTGLYAPTHAVDVRGKRLDPAIETLPDALARAGYRVPDMFFLTVLPNFENLGFTDTYADRDRLIDDGDEVLFRWLEDEAGKEDSPFFLYYHYRDLHLPYNPGPDYEPLYMPAEFSRGSLRGTLGWFLAREKMDVVKSNVMLVRGVMDFDQGDRPWVDALYDAQVRLLDERLFKRLRQTLAQGDLGRETIVVVSADHGEELLDRGLIGHVSTFKEGRLYDEILRIPLIFWGPGVVPAGRVVDEVVQCTDVMPTLLELAGLPPEPVQGRSLAGLMRGEAWQEKPVYGETSAGGYTADSLQYEQRFRVVRTRDWKLLYEGPDERYSLFDLQKDPLESRDVQARHPQVADSLRTLLNEWVLYSQPQAPSAPPPVVAVAPLSGAGGPPRILFPADGDTLFYRGANHSIQPRWDGPASVEYGVEYIIGEGAYFLEGEISVTGNAPLYGPFQPGFWNSLVLYNPWKFRVYRRDRPQEKSEWVRFDLAPAGGAAATPWTALLWSAPVMAAAAVGEVGKLIKGLGLGAVDLYRMAAQVPAADWSAWGLLAAIVAALGRPAVVRVGVARSKAWGLALVYIAFVYSTVPLMPQIWRRLHEHTEGAVRYLGIVAVLGAGAWLLRRAWMRLGRRSWRPYLGLAAVLALYGYLLAVYARFPSERLHLVEYGFMGYVLFRALRLDMPVRWAYAVAWGLTLAVGFGDECIQWALPQRFFELKDVQLNAVAGGLGLALVRLVSDPRDEPRREPL